jgi:hypothetical protein
MRIKTLVALTWGVLLLALPAAGQAPAAATPDRAKLEARLKERAEAFYTAIQNSQWKKVESFLNEDAKVIWAGEKKQAILGFKLLSTKVFPEGKEGLSETAVESTLEFPGFGAHPIRVPQKREWIWENNDWYVLLRNRPRIDPSVTANPPVPPPDPTAKPELYFTSTAYDFKLIRRGEPIRGKFYFTNKSDHVVQARIEAFNPCNCVTVKGTKQELKPGEDGSVEVIMETKDFGGYLTQGIEVNMQPSGARLYLRLVGTIVMPNQIIPQDR